MKLVSIVILLLFSVFLYSQHTVKGLIKVDDDLDNRILYIEIYDSNFVLIKQEILEESTKFLIKFDSSHIKTKILVSSLGCDIFAKELNFKASNEIFISILLKNCTQELEQVIVKANRTFQEEKGDTTIFDIDGFRNATDITLGDILKKIPGLEIVENNQIHFKGKRIDKILLEGRDILNDQHKLALDGLKASDIKKIEIIQEYRPFSKLFSEEYNDKVAMNIKLEEHAKNRINGNYEVQGGWKEKYLLETELISVRQKEGSASFVRSNNTGEEIFSVIDFIGLHARLDRLTNGQTGQVNLIPAIFLPQQNLTELNQQFISSSYDFDISKKATGKLSGMGVFLKHAKEAMVTTNYFDTNSTFLGSNKENASIPYLYVVGNIKQKINDKTNLELDVPITLYTSKKNNVRNGNWDKERHSTSINIINKNIHILPQLLLSQKHNKKWSSSHSLLGELNRQTDKVNFKELELANDSLFQDTKSSKYLVELTSKYNYNFKNLFFQFSNQIAHLNQRVQIIKESIPFLGQKEANIRFTEWKPNFQFGIKSEKWTTIAELGISNYAYKNNIEERGTQLNPSLLVKYSWSKFHNIGFNLESNIYPIDQTKAFGIYLFRDNQYFQFDNLSSTELTKSKNFSVYYVTINAPKKQTFINHLNYSIEEQAISRISRREDSFIISEAFLADKVKRLTTNSTLRNNFVNKNFILSNQFIFVYTNTKRNMELDVESANFNINSIISTDFDRNWNFSLGINYNRYSQMIGENQQTFQTIIPSFESRLITYKWRAKLKYSHFRNRILLGQSKNIPVIRLNIDYTLNKILSLKLNIIDLLNLGESRNVLSNYTDFYFENQDFKRLNGSVLLGIEGQF